MAYINTNFPSQVVSDVEKISFEYGLKVGKAIEKEWFDTYADENKTYIHVLKEGGNMYDAGNIPRLKIKNYTKIRR